MIISASLATNRFDISAATPDPCPIMFLDSPSNTRVGGGGKVNFWKTLQYATTCIFCL